MLLGWILEPEFSFSDDKKMARSGGWVIELPSQVDEEKKSPKLKLDFLDQLTFENNNEVSELCIFEAGGAINKSLMVGVSRSLHRVR